MISPFKRLTSFQKFFITLSVIFVVAIIDYQSFLDKSRKIELYDELHSRISSARVSITKLEYLLDMFVVARRFEGDTIEIIKGDVASLNENISELMDNPVYRSAWKADTILADGIQSIGDDWATIKNEIKRLNDAMSQDEVMLTHNAVDMNTVLANEKAERLLVAISERRKAVFNESKALAMRSIVGFVLLMLVMSLVYYKKVISPVSKAAAVARRLLSGDMGARFNEGTGAIDDLSAELNRMAESIGSNIIKRDEESASLKAFLAERSAQVAAISSIMNFAGTSLAQNEVFAFAIEKALSAVPAEAGAIYVLEGGVLRLKTCFGFDEKSYAETSSLDAFPGASAQGPVAFDQASGAPYQLSGVIGPSGAAIAVPLMYNNRAAGLLLAVYRDRARYNTEHLRFFEAVASSISVASGHSGLIQQEHSSRKFLERLLMQLPVGLAVFSSDGRCALMSSQARRMLGADPGMETSDYNVFEDVMLKSQGILTAVRKSYEGFSTEFVINYSPMSSRAIGIAMAPVRLKIRSFPLYDAGGEVSSIALMYEGISEDAAPSGGRG